MDDTPWSADQGETWGYLTMEVVTVANVHKDYVMILFLQLFMFNRRVHYNTLLVIT